MINADQLREGLGRYIQAQMMPRLDDKRQFLLGMAYGLCAGKMDAMLEAAGKNPAIRALGIIQENGEIDIDALYNAAYAQMQAQKKLTLDIPLLGSFAFGESDLRDLYNAISQT